MNLSDHGRGIERKFWDRVTPPRDQYDCWLWRGTIYAEDGYGRLKSGKPPYKNLSAHRFSYELHKGPIPAGLTLDHLCRVRHCVNPAHLDPVTSAVNTMRGSGCCVKHADKTHCIYGHALSGSNLRLRKGGGRDCHACRKQWAKDYKARKRAASIS